MVEIHPLQISGRRVQGVALDLHTTSSTPIGQDQFGRTQFNTVRPPIAELLYQLKYRHNVSAATEIIATTAEFIRPHRASFDILIPVPPSTPRYLQPVTLLANGIGEALNMPVHHCITTTRATTQLKEIQDPEERRAHLKGLYAVDAQYTAGTRVLLFDDLFRSGSTMDAITDLLLNGGQAASVLGLTITRTRSNR